MRYRVYTSVGSILFFLYLPIFLFHAYDPPIVAFFLATPLVCRLFDCLSFDRCIKSRDANNRGFFALEENKKISGMEFFIRIIGKLV